MPTARSTGRRRALVVAALVVLVAVVGAAVHHGGGAAPRSSRPRISVRLSSPVTPPQDWSAKAWDELLGREAWRDGDLSLLTAAPSDVEDPQGARDVASAALRARLSADPAGRAGFEAYLADPFASEDVATDATRRFAGRCRDVDVVAAAPARLPSPGEVAKVLVLWGGDCVDGLSEVMLAGRARDPETLQVSYLYLRREAGRWRPVRETQLPGSAAGDQDAGETVPSYLLADMRCGSSPLEGSARLEVVAAFSAMCEDAAADGVALHVTATMRTAAEQAASAEGGGRRCTSRHCAGWAVDVSGDGATGWLSAAVGCQDRTGTLQASCADGAPVARALTYGFAQPFAGAPGHLEYVLPPMEQRWGASCRPRSDASAPEVVASVWRCRLGEAGLSREEVRDAVARALLVSRCESGWNASLVAFGGRYVDSPDPSTGRTYDGTGLFQLPPAEVRRANGGRATDAVANADAAARRYLTSVRSGADGFSSWPCAASLPAAGAAVPAWAYRW